MYDISVVIILFAFFLLVLCMKVWLIKQVILICKEMLEIGSTVVDKSILIEKLHEE